MKVEHQGCHVYNPNDYPSIEEISKMLEEAPPNLKKAGPISLSVIRWYMFNIYNPALARTKLRQYRKSNLFSSDYESKTLLRDQLKLFIQIENLSVEWAIRGHCCLEKRNSLMNEIRINHECLKRGNYGLKARA